MPAKVLSVSRAWPAPTGDKVERNLERLRWRARRGLLELDIVLGRFIEAHYAQLDEAGRQAFEVLLDMPDNPLWDMVAGRQEAAPGEQQALLEKIRAA
jgi:antitoxin CptB